MERAAWSSGVPAATLASTALIAQQVAGKAVRESLFLSSFQAKHLPHAMAAASVLSLVTVALMPLLTSRVSPRRLVPLLFVASAAGFLLGRLLFTVTPRGGALGVYLQTSVFGPILISAFWSLINERFDPHAAKRMIAPITGGGTVGGVLGGLAAWRASSVVTVPTSVLLLAGLSILGAASVVAIPAPPESAAPRAARVTEESHPRSAFSLLRTTPFLRDLALFVALGAVVSSLLDYILGAQAVARYGKGPDLFEFFSIFSLAVAGISLVLQFSVGRVALQKTAIAVHIAVLPGTVLVGGALGLAIPGLLSAALLRGAEMVHRNTLFRSAYELLYTPISEEQKRATKTVIDVGCDRAGTILGSLLTMGVIYAAGANQTVIIGLVVGLTVVALPLARRLHAGYVAELEKRLLDGAAQLEDAEGPAPQSVEGEDRAREKLIRRAQQLQGQGPARGPTEALLGAPGEVLRITGELLSHDRQRTRAALGALDVRTRPAAGAAILLLADHELHRDARLALRRIAPHITGQLLDLLLDPSTEVVVRCRLAPIVGAAGTQRAADGLALALADSRFEVRYAVGRTLFRLVRSGELVVPQEKVHDALLAAATREGMVAATIEEDSLSDEAPIDIVIQDRVTRGLEHVFTLLSMLVDREGIRLCFRALHQEDSRYRGTALEYLQSVLPAEVHHALAPLLGADAGPLPAPRPASEVLADLTRTIRLTGDVDPVSSQPVSPESHRSSAGGGASPK